MPRNPLTDARRRTARTDEILDTAEQLFSRRGFDGASIADVAAAARLTKQEVYEYFPDKAALCHRVLDRALQRLQVELDGDVDGEGSSAKRLARAVGRLCQFVRERRDLIRLVDEEPASGELKRRRLRWREKRQELFADLLRAGARDGSLVPVQDANLYAAALSGAMRSAALAYHGKLEPEDLGIEVAGTLLGGLIPAQERARLKLA